jgi:hypothetical protein
VRWRRSWLRPLARPKRHESGVLTEFWMPPPEKAGIWSAHQTPEAADEHYAAMVERLKHKRLPHPTSVKLFHAGELLEEMLIESEPNGERGKDKR